MSGNLVITIGRQCGSSGKIIGQKLAEEMGVKCYDKELLALAAKNSGLCEELFETHDEKRTFCIPWLWIHIPWDIRRPAIWICRLIIRYFLHSLIPSNSWQIRNPV